MTYFVSNLKLNLNSVTYGFYGPDATCVTQETVSKHEINS